jgi:hypothetical protein
MTMQELTKTVIGMAIEIHRTMGPGFNESIYHRCLEIELAAAGIDFESKVPIDVFYKGTVNYLTATQIDDGLILNLGAPSLEIRHKYRLYTPRSVKDVAPFDLH